MFIIKKKIQITNMWGSNTTALGGLINKLINDHILNEIIRGLGQLIISIFLITHGSSFKDAADKTDIIIIIIKDLYYHLSLKTPAIDSKEKRKLLSKLQTTLSRRHVKVKPRNGSGRGSANW